MIWKVKLIFICAVQYHKMTRLLYIHINVYAWHLDHSVNQMVPFWVGFFLLAVLSRVSHIHHAETDFLPLCLQGILKLIPKTSLWPPAGWRLSKVMNCNVSSGKRGWWETEWWLWKDTTWRRGSGSSTDASTAPANTVNITQAVPTNAKTSQ